MKFYSKRATGTIEFIVAIVMLFFGLLIAYVIWEAVGFGQLFIAYMVIAIIVVLGILFFISR